MQTTGTATLTKTDRGILIQFRADNRIRGINYIKDGGNLVARAERHLRAAGIVRTSGYEMKGGEFVAVATEVA